MGGQKITAAQLNAMIESLPEQYRANAQGPGRRDFAENLARLKALSDEARRRGIDKTPAYQAQLAFQADNLLGGLLYSELLKSVEVPDSEARAYYEKVKKEFERVQARHILIRFQGSPVPVRPGQPDLSEQEAFAKAQVLRKKLQAGADFAVVAKAESDDTGSGANGGELGLFRRGQMVPSFEDAAFTLPEGQLSEPVRSQFGYHLIQVEKKETKTFEEVRPDMVRRARPELAKKAVDELRKQVTVTMDPEYYFEQPKK